MDRRATLGRERSSAVAFTPNTSSTLTSLLDEVVEECELEASIAKEEQQEVIHNAIKIVKTVNEDEEEEVETNSNEGEKPSAVVEDKSAPFKPKKRSKFAFGLGRKKESPIKKEKLKKGESAGNVMEKSDTEKKKAPALFTASDTKIPRISSRIPRTEQPLEAPRKQDTKVEPPVGTEDAAKTDLPTTTSQTISTSGESPVTVPEPIQTTESTATTEMIEQPRKTSRPSELKKQLLCESAMSDSSLYRARRFSVSQPPNWSVSPIQVEAHDLRTRGNTISSDASALPFSDQLQRIKQMFENTLRDEWRVNLFKRFLQEKNKGILLEFYLSIQSFKEAVKKTEQIDQSAQSTQYTEALQELQKQATLLCIQYARDQQFPSKFRVILKDSAVPLLLISFNQNTLNPIGQKSGTDQNPNNGLLELPDELEPILSTSETDSDHDTDNEEEDESEPFVGTLEEEQMKILQTNDPSLLLKDPTIIKQHLENSSFINSGKLFYNFVFYLIEKRIYNLFVNDLFPQFICSHNQIINISATLNDVKKEEIENQEANDKAEKQAKPADSKEKTGGQPPKTEKAAEETDIVYGESKDVIDACTFQRCITHLITTGNISNDFHFSAVVTFHYFSDLCKFINGMREHLRKLLEKAESLYPEENIEAFKKKNVIPVIIRITSVLRIMFDFHLEYFRYSDDQFKFLLKFITQDIIPQMETAGTTLKEFMLKKIKQKETEKVELQFDKKPPKPKICRAISNAKDISAIQLSLIQPIEFARQLAILDHQLYKDIRPEECLHMRWTKSDKNLKSPHLLASINQFCRVGMWVSNEIVEEINLEKRVQILQKMITIAHECLKLRNFNGAMAIISGLQSHSVFRLKNTWDGLTDKFWDLWEELKDIFKCDQNFATLRLVNAESALPAVPYLGMYLSDLTFIDNESNFVDEEKIMINFVKMHNRENQRYIGSITRQIQKYQQGAYCLKPVKILQDYIIAFPNHADTDLYQKSMKCETKRANCKSVDISNKKDKAGFLNRLGKQQSARMKL